MSLDQNLFTLFLTPSQDNPNVVDLVDPAGTVYYRKLRLPGPAYKAEVYDPLSESLLITATAPSSTSKVKVLELCNPSSVVELKSTGTITFRWGFKWEQHDFEWKREECFMLRKPDPPVLVAITKEPTGRLRTSSVQILDYNLNRFDIDDRKGLEIVILTALLTFQDANETYHARGEGSATSITSNADKSNPSTPAGDKPPPPPPKPAPKTGVDRIAEMQAVRGVYNEIVVEDEGALQDYAQYCSNLLQDDALLFITIKSEEAQQVPKVLQVVEETKRIRHKAGLSEEEELHQYVLYDLEAKKGPRRIVLDDKEKVKTYAPPSSLTVHLSKIPMPELQPKASVSEKTRKDSRIKEEKKKEEKKEEKKVPTPPPSSRPPGKLSRPKRSPSPQSKVHAHQVHPNQPSPSPSQLNNPSIYTAPPPPRHSTRPPRPVLNSTLSPQSPGFPMPSVPSASGWNSPFSSGRPLSYAGNNPSLYGPHAGYTSPGAAYPYGSSGSADVNHPWQSPGPPPPPPSSRPQQEQATSPTGHKPTLSASNVVSGLFDKFHHKR